MALLSKAASPVKLENLILSDVIGNPLDVIALGPTAPDPTTFVDAISTLRKSKIENEMTVQVL
ncbi:DUF4147 domain-containing protein [uncultured Draconibacterium sp.]|uniref:DUF4147 domain-containing protein n=1 Tax=uncultured Draconibacterium sp. TaxID=1573823 RepID=UPI0037492E8B